MDSAQKFEQLFWNLAGQLPSLIAIIGCMVFVVTRWKRYPKVSLMTLMGLLLIFVADFLFGVIFIWAPDLLTNRDRASVTGVFTALGLISNTVFAIAFIFLLAAIFIQRRRSSQDLGSTN
jgi:uncharacterized membrane protein